MIRTILLALVASAFAIASVVGLIMALDAPRKRLRRVGLAIIPISLAVVAGAFYAVAASADTIPIVDGLLTVHTGDILVTSKPLTDRITASGTMVQAAGSIWINRMDGKPFTLSGGATKLGIITAPAVGYALNGFTYQVMDGTPVPVVAAPPVSSGAGPAPAPPAAASALVGANLAGCYAAAGGALCPLPSEIDAYVAANIGDIFRFAIKDDTPFDKLIPAIDEALAKGKIVIIDRHDYAWHSAADNLAYWKAKLGKYVGNPRVYIDLDNEPRGFNSTTIPNDFMEWAAGTRDTEALFLANGLTNPVLTEWPQSSAIFRFDKGEAATKDCESAGCAIDRTPGFPITGNVILSPHEYLDHGSSGTNAACDPYSWTDSFAAQVRKRHLRAIIGEQAWGKYSGVPATCAAPGAATLAGIRANADVIIGFTQWGGGREWPAGYIFAIAPKGQTLDNAYVHSLTNR
ncbi:cellulase family glycosylhydrolase [uncultured Sphingomonas sp.]|uniref:cellulase family glycosylhydrolase n=1 Tax=uncultured Sphingomonas sp. TaxID=158754 RepID=UPI00260C0B14|nr:cellulase family glycosylhydrolase [uncultured Sphingomonas sp.]